MSGVEPFGEVPSQAKVVIYIAKGYTPMPRNHPELEKGDRLWKLMKKCWNTVPKERPSMGEIIDEVCQVISSTYNKITANLQLLAVPCGDRGSDIQWTS